MADKRTTVDDIVGELRSGMTIGIGGWGSRRKPMAVVRAICRSDLTDLTVVAYGGPDVGLLCATGKVRKVVCGFVTLDSIALDPHWRAARQHGQVEVMEVDEGMFFLGLQAASWRVPFLPTRAGLGSDVLTINPDLRLVRSPYGAGQPVSGRPGRRRRRAGGHAGPPARRRHRPRQPGRHRRQRADPEPRPVLRHAVPRRRRAALPHHRAHRRERRAGRRGPPALDRAHPPHADRRRGRGPRRRALHRQPARLRPRRGVPEGVRRRRRPTRPSGRPSPTATSSSTRTSTRPASRSGRRSERRGRRRHPGRVLRGRLRRGLARRRRGHGQPVRHHPRRSAPGWPSSPSRPTSSSPTARRR